MAIRDEDFGSALTLVEGDDGLWSPPVTAPACAPPDLHLLYEQEVNRAKSAEARVQELLNDTRRLRRALRKTEAGGRTACPGCSACVPDGRPKPPPPTRRRHRAPAPAKSQQETIKSLRGERGELRKEVTRLNKEVTRMYWFGCAVESSGRRLRPARATNRTPPLSGRLLPSPVRTTTV